MEAIFTGLGHIFSGNSGMINVFKVALLVNCLMSMLKFIIDPKGGLLTSFWVSLVVYLVLFTPTGTAVLVKPTYTNVHQSAARPIAGEIPIGILYPAEVVSTLGAETAQAFRDAFVSTNLGWGGGQVNANGYLISNRGLDPLIALNTMRQAYTNDAFSKQGVGAGSNSGIQEAVQSYLESCVVRNNKTANVTGDAPIKITTGMNAADAWSEYAILRDWPIRFELNGVVRNTTCRSGHAIIDTAIKDRAKEISKQYLGTSTYAQDSDSSYAERLANTNSFLQEMTTSGGDTMHQMLSNQFIMSAVTGNCSDSVLLSKADVQICRAQFDQIQSRRNVEASKATGFKEMFIPMVTFMEGFVYLITPFILFVVLLLGVKGLSLAGKYLTALVWIVLMPICQVAVDLYLSVYFSKFLTRLQNDVAGSNLISMNAQSSVWTDLESFISFAGTAQAMVPTLAMFILFAGVHTLMGIASGGGNSGASQSSMGGNVAAQTKNGQSVYGNQQSTNLGGGSVTQKQSAVANDSDKVGSISVSSGSTFQTVQQSTQQSTQQAQTASSAAMEAAYGNSNESAYSQSSKIARGMGYSNTDSHMIGNLVSSGMSWGDAESFVREHSENIKFDASSGATITGNVNEITKQLGSMLGGGRAKGLSKMVDYLDELTDASPLVKEKGRGGDDADWMPKFQLKMAASGGWSVAQQDKGTDTWTQTKQMNEQGSENMSETNQAVKTTLAEMAEQRMKTHKDSFTENDKAAITANKAYLDSKSVSDAVSELDSTKFDNNIQISNSAPTAANIGSDFSKIASGKHFEEFNNSLVNSFLSDEEKAGIFGQGKEFDFSTASDSQIKAVLGALDENERQTLQESGFVKMSDDGYSMSQMTTAESISKATGHTIHNQDLATLSTDGTDDTSRRTKSAQRAQLLQDVFGGVLDTFKGSEVNGAHRDELVSAAGSWFESAGNEKLVNGGQLGELARMGSMLSSFDRDNLKSASGNVDDMEYRGNGAAIESTVNSAVGSASRFDGMENDSNGILSKLAEMDLASNELQVGNPQLKENFRETIAAIEAGTLSGKDMVNAANSLSSQVDSATSEAKTNIDKGEDVKDRVNEGISANKARVTAAPEKVPFLGGLFSTSAGNTDQRLDVIRDSELKPAMNAFDAIGAYNSYMQGNDNTPGLVSYTENGRSFDEQTKLKELTTNWKSHDSPEAVELKQILGEQQYNDFAALKTEALSAVDYISSNQAAQNIGAALFNNEANGTGGGFGSQLYSDLPNEKLLNAVRDDYADDGKLTGNTLGLISNAYDDFNNHNAGKGIEKLDSPTVVEANSGSSGLTRKEIPAIISNFTEKVGVNDMTVGQRSAMTDYLKSTSSFSGDYNNLTPMKQSGLSDEQIKDIQQYRDNLDGYNQKYMQNNPLLSSWLQGKSGSSGSYEAKIQFDPSVSEVLSDKVGNTADKIMEYISDDDYKPVPKHSFTGNDAKIANEALNEVMYGKGLDPLGKSY